MSYVTSLRDAVTKLNKGETVGELRIPDSPAGIAVAYVSDSRLHHHARTHEFYFVSEGEGDLFLDNQKYHIEKDSVVYISPGTRHKVKSRNGIRLLVVTSPPWSQDDNILDE